MADWNDIRKAFEKDLKKNEASACMNEQQMLKSVTFYICSKKGISPIQGYEPKEIVSFLEQPVSDIRICLGSEWDNVSNAKLENMVYSLSQKVKKSGQLLFG